MVATFNYLQTAIIFLSIICLCLGKATPGVPKLLLGLRDPPADAIEFGTYLGVKH